MTQQKIPKPIILANSSKLSRNKRPDDATVKVEADFLFGLVNEYDESKPMLLRKDIAFKLILFSSGSAIGVEVTEENLTTMLDYVRKVKTLANNEVPISLSYEDDA